MRTQKFLSKATRGPTASQPSGGRELRPGKSSHLQKLSFSLMDHISLVSFTLYTKLVCMSESPGGLVKCRLRGSFPEHPYQQARGRADNLHFSPISRQCHCGWSKHQQREPLLPLCQCTGREDGHQHGYVCRTQLQSPGETHSHAMATSWKTELTDSVAVQYSPWALSYGQTHS